VTVVDFYCQTTLVWQSDRHGLNYVPTACSFLLLGHIIVKLDLGSIFLCLFVLLFVAFVLRTKESGGNREETAFLREIP
jgi:hypothetical protein